MAKNRIIYLIFLIVSIIYYIDYEGWLSSFVLLLVLCLPLLSLLCSIPSIVNAKLNVSVRKTCLRNEKNDVRFSTGGGWFGVSPLLRLHVTTEDLLGGETVQYDVTVPRGVTSSVPMSTEHCGVYECSVLKAYVCDFLGLFRFKVKAPGKITVTVRPTPVCPVPVPEMTSFNARALRPKAGGGFSEIHEMREYRPGDPMNSVHWKLSAKADDLIIREAMEPERQLIIVSLDLTSDRTRYDRTLDRLVWVSGELVKLNVKHSVYYLGAEDGALCSFVVEKDEDLTALLSELLSKPIRGERKSLASRPFSEADWRYHIMSEEVAAGE